MTEVIAILAGFVVLMGLGAVVGIVDGRRQRQAWRRIAEARRSLHSARRSYIAAGADVLDLDHYWGIQGRSRWTKVLLLLAEIENEAARVLDEQLGPAERQLFRVRSELRQLGVWSESELESFDRAMAFRNSVIHGDKVPSSGDAHIAEDELVALLETLRKTTSR
jgi:hypothetical protein